MELDILRVSAEGQGDDILEWAFVSFPLILQIKLVVQIVQFTLFVST